MKIKELELKNFGKFSGARFSFEDGINVVYGMNETGKTTMYHALCGMLFGLEKQRGRGAKNDTYSTYQPWENKTWYEGSLQFEAGGKRFYLERNFYHQEKSARLFCLTDGEELSVEAGDLEMLLGNPSAQVFYNTAAVGQLKMKPQDIVYSYLKNYIAGVQEAGNQGIDVMKALSVLEGKRKALEQKKKQQVQEWNAGIARADARLEVVEKEISGYLGQLEMLELQREGLLPREKTAPKGFWKRLIRWLKSFFGRKRLRFEEQQRREELLKLEEKKTVLRELLGEKESFREELLLEREGIFEKFHQQSKEEELQALELAMNRIREISVLRKEEVMEQLLMKASEILCRLTKGKYQKLILEENEEPCVWDGRCKRSLFQVSAGCTDQVYLALRIGLQDLFFQEETLPLLFDDAFVYFDDKRLERLLLYLNELGRQVILFSCHKRELRILEQNQISYGKIIL